MRAQCRGLGLIAGVVLVAGCYQPVRPEATSEWVHEDPLTVSALEREDAGGNGIYVQEPKIYDDASLRMMLDAIRTKLGTMTGLNQDALTSHVGGVSGATISQQQFGFGIASAAPSVSTTAGNATNSATTDSTGTSTTTNSPTLSTTTNSPAAPTPPTVPAGIAFAPPTSVSPSSLDVLNEQMQLSYELANLELLLEGSLSDRFVKNQRIVKPRVTMGFPITLYPRPEFKDAVAVVEVEATIAKYDLSAEPPAVTALLPREQTYNVVAMTDRTTSIGAGAILGAISVGASFLSGHKTLYVVKDQDTVAVQMPALPKSETAATEANRTARFAWEFHPVLGERYVRAGPKQAFVQLALPVLAHYDCFGSVRIRTYWRRFDQDSGLVGDVIPGSVFRSSRDFSIAHYRLEPHIGITQATDLGDGTLMVKVQGSFLNGTYVQLGPARFDAGKNLVVEDTDLRFVAPASAFAQWTAQIVARSGESAKLLNNSSPMDALTQTACVESPAQSVSPSKQHRDDSATNEAANQDSESGVDPSEKKAADQQKKQCTNPYAIKFTEGPVVHPFDESRSVVQLTVAADCSNTDAPELPDDLLLAIGGKAFGLRDAPILRHKNQSGRSLSIAATIPTALLTSSMPSVTVFRPLWSDVEGFGHNATGNTRIPDAENHYYASAPLTSKFDLDSEVERLVLVALDKDGNAIFILYGNGLDNAKVLSPQTGASLNLVHGLNGGQTRYLKMTKVALAQAKKVVLLKSDSVRPTVLGVPALPTSSDKAKAKVSIDSPVVQNTQEITAKVDQARELASIKMGDTALHSVPIDESTVRLVHLKDDGVTTDQKTCELTFTYKNGDKVTIKLDIVAARINVR